MVSSSKTTHNGYVWPFARKTVWDQPGDPWIAIVACERQTAQLIEANLSRQGHLLHRFSSVAELLEIQGIKPMAIIVDALEQGLTDVKRAIRSTPGWEDCVVISPPHSNGSWPPDWPNSGFPGAAAVITQLDQ